MKKSIKYLENQSYNEEKGGRDRYCLRLPSEFFSRGPRKADLSGEVADMRGVVWTSGGPQNQQEIKQAANTLKNLLPRSQPTNYVQNNQQCFPRQGVKKAPNIQSPNNLILQNRQSNTVSCHSEQQPEVFIENQPYRTTPIVLPHAKSIHETGELGNKFLVSDKKPQNGSVTPYRNSALIMPGPRTIHEVGASGGQYRGYEQYRGPQYWADRGYTPVPASHFPLEDPGLMEKPTVSRVYNSPAMLYSEENLAAALQESGIQAVEAGQDDVNNHEAVDSTKLIPMAVTSNPVANGGSGTQKSARSHSHPPINQSSSFKKVMYSVGMRDEEF